MKQDGYIEFAEEEEQEKVKRPELMGKAVPLYDMESSRIPERIRVSFSDGKTAVYELHVELPEPCLMECISIIRKWNTGYQHKPNYKPKHERRNRW